MGGWLSKHGKGSVVRLHRDAPGGVGGAGTGGPGGKLSDQNMRPEASWWRGSAM